MEPRNVIHELPKGLLWWYEFHKGGRALFVTGGDPACEVLAEALAECGLAVDCAGADELVSVGGEGKEQNLQGQAAQEKQETEGEEAAARYDVIVLAGALERSQAPAKLLKILYGMLSPKGRLILGADNRLGIRYFCGDRDVFTGRNFDGIENYVRINAADMGQLKGRAYARAELKQMLKAAGFSQYRFYSVLPGLVRPQAIFAEDYLPEEELEVRIFPQYHYPDTVFLEEERLYTTLMENGLFHTLANGYLVECPMDGCFANALQVTLSMDRGEENALMTVIRRDGKVEKRALYEEGKKKLQQMMENQQDLQKHGVKMVDACLEKDAFVMPYVKGESATDYFRRVFFEDRERFLEQLDRLWDIILQSSEHVPYEDVDWEHFEPGWEKRKADDPGKDKWRKAAFGSKEEQENLGVILKRGYIDLVCLNAFHAEGSLAFYDQEFYVENLPAKVILQRTIDLVYCGNTRMEALLPRDQLQKRYHLEEYKDLWYRFIGSFMADLRKERELREYHQMYRRNAGILHSNRQRMNYSEEEYGRIFRDIFRGTEGKRIYLFGSGNFTKKFLSQFAGDYEIAGILDNNPGKWGTEMSGIPVLPPDKLQPLAPESYKVIICIKNYVPVMRQLKALGVKNYGVYDWNLEYPRKLPVPAGKKDGEDPGPKKYHVGYIAGVFDLFHVGHLNMFRRAKEQCDYLIVGVVSDESVMKNKKTMPCIPFAERMELVQACRYVDEAVEIPADYGDTDEAYRRYQFDVQFSGSDYEEDPVWLAKREYLRKRGADLVFFPYTETTSSTKIKAVIAGRLKE